ncbi:MAG: hypothetical protein V7K89_26800 [Nostoc sp.]|uniref:hypothetical protein n=1 Tax=Nostoc sp. TaxID=1180 RepID=UPI002FF92502
MTKRFMFNTLLSVSALVLLSSIPKTLAEQSVPTTSLNPNSVTQSELNLKPSSQFVLAKNKYPKRISAEKYNKAYDILKKARALNDTDKPAPKGTTVPFCRAFDLFGAAQYERQSADKFASENDHPKESQQRFIEVDSAMKEAGKIVGISEHDLLNFYSCPY